MDCESEFKWRSYNRSNRTCATHSGSDKTCSVFTTTIAVAAKKAEFRLCYSLSTATTSATVDRLGLDHHYCDKRSRILHLNFDYIFTKGMLIFTIILTNTIYVCSSKCGWFMLFFEIRSYNLNAVPYCDRILQSDQQTYQKLEYKYYRFLVCCPTKQCLSNFEILMQIYFYLNFLKKLIKENDVYFTNLSYEYTSTKTPIPNTKVDWLIR